MEAQARAAGMTAAEADVWTKVCAAARAYLDLTEAEPHHHMEREEICHAFHSIQGWLAGRPFVRALGDAYEPKPEAQHCRYGHASSWWNDQTGLCDHPSHRLPLLDVVDDRPKPTLCDGCGQEIRPGEEHTFCYPAMP